MNCQNCNAQLNPGQTFCHVCGQPVNSTQAQYNQNNQQLQNRIQPDNTQINISNQPIINNNSNTINTQQNNNYNQTYMNNYSDENLINAYIGKNAEKLKQGGFSINTFFFGTLYVLYRKMWLLGLLWMVGGILVSSILGNFGYIILIAANILISVQFKKWYLEHVRKKVQKIKMDNNGASQEQLVMLCNKKGGTTILPIVIFVILYAIITAFAISSVTKYLNQAREDMYEDEEYGYQEENNEPTTIDNNKIGDLTYEIPTALESSEYNTNNYKSYRLINMDDHCSATFTTTSNYNEYATAKEYLKDDVYYSASDKVSSITTKQINGVTWYTMNVQTSYNKSYYYSMIYNDTIYELEYSITDDSGVCGNAHTSTINSLKIK